MRRDQSLQRTMARLPRLLEIHAGCRADSKVCRNGGDWLGHRRTERGRAPHWASRRTRTSRQVSEADRESVRETRPPTLGRAGDRLCGRRAAPVTTWSKRSKTISIPPGPSGTREGREAPRSNVERGVPGVINPGRASEPVLASNLEIEMQGRARFPPRLVRDVGPRGTHVVAPLPRNTLVIAQRVGTLLHRAARQAAVDEPSAAAGKSHFMGAPSTTTGGFSRRPAPTTSPQAPFESHRPPSA